MQRIDPRREGRSPRADEGSTIQFEMQFLSSARIGEFIELRPEVVRRTASLVFLRGVLTADVRSVAAASGIRKRVRRAPPSR